MHVSVRMHTVTGGLWPHYREGERKGAYALKPAGMDLAPAPAPLLDI